MAMTPIAKIVTDIQQQPGWDGVRDWGLIIQAWSDCVSPAIATRSRPRSLSRDILTIATHSASLAHQLTFGRRALCQQLNARLTQPIADLRFAPIGYAATGMPTETEEEYVSIDSGEIVICSHCSCRCRQGELLRWGMCQFCAIDLGILGGRRFP